MKLVLSFTLFLLSANLAFAQSPPRKVHADVVELRPASVEKGGVVGVEYRSRDTLVGRSTDAAPAGGLYLWCRLGQGLSATALHDRALANGVTFVPGPAFYPDPAGDGELRLCFTSVLPSTIDESVKRLARCVGEVRMTA
jgi:hypothetical protein